MPLLHDPIKERFPMNAKEKTVDALKRVLKSENSAHRCYAVQALGKIRDNVKMEDLIQSLDDEDEDVVIDAIGVLGDLEEPRAIPVLRDCYRDSPNGEVKVAVVESLGRIGGDPVIEFMTEVLRGPGEGTEWTTDGEWDDWWDAQVKALEALGRLGNPQAARAVADVLWDEDQEDLIEAGFQALAVMGSAGENLLLEFLEQGIPKLRRKAATRLAGHSSIKVVEALAQAVQDPEIPVLLSSARALAGCTEPSVSHTLFKLLKHSENKVRSNILIILREHEIPIPESLLNPLLNDRSEAVREQALACIGVQGMPRSYDLVYQKLRDSSLTVVKAAIRTLGQLGDSRAADTLGALLAREELTPEIRSEAALALGQMDSEEVISLLTHALQNADTPVRMNILRVIAEQGNEASFEILVSALKGELLRKCPESNEEEQMLESPGNASSSEKSRQIPKDTSELSSTEPQGNEELSAMPAQSTLEAIAREGMEMDGDLEEEAPTANLTSEEQEFLQLAEENIDLGQQLIQRQHPEAGEEIRRLAASLLIAFDPERTWPHLVQALSDSSTEVQSTAAESLGYLKSVNALIPLSRLLNSQEFLVRIKVADALGNLENPEAVPLLMDHLEDPHPAVRVRVINALGKLAGLLSANSQKKLNRRMRACLQSVEEGVCKAASEVLLRSGACSAVNDTIRMVLDSKGELRYEAGRLLRTYAAEESSKQLREILASPQEEVYSMTIEMLGEIHRTV